MMELRKKEWAGGGVVSLREAIFDELKSSDDIRQMVSLMGELLVLEGLVNWKELLDEVVYEELEDDD